MRQLTVVACAVVLAFPGSEASAGAVTDGSLGAQVSLSGAFNIPATLGTTIGSNLFHSFASFSLATGEIATFTGPAGLSNIVGRVTGGTASNINGQIASTVSGANVYLLNPSGIVFGPNASLSVPGAFYASTANYLRLADGSRFYADIGNASSFTAADPAAFGFLNSSAAPIAVNGATLTVLNGMTLGLVGGDISISASGTLNAASGEIRIASARSAGEVVTLTGPDASGLAALGAVSMSGGSTLNVSEAAGAAFGGGRVFIRAGQLTLANSNITANSISGNGTGIDIAVTGDASVSGVNILAVTTGTHNAGAINISANTLAVSAGALIDTSCDPGCSTGMGGALNLNVAGALNISGGAGVVSNTFGGGASGLVTINAGVMTLSGGALLQSRSLAAGNAGGLTVNAASLSVLSGGQMDTSTDPGPPHAGPLITGSGGPLAVNVSGAMIVSGAGSGSLTGLFSNSVHSSGNAGSVQITAGSLSLLAGGEIASAAGRNGATGTGGLVRITTPGALNVEGSKGIFTNAFGTGNAGQIDLTAGSLSVSNSGKIQSQGEPGSSGRGGNIAIRAGSLAVSSGGQISVDARGSGDSGSIQVAADRVDISGSSNTGIFANTYAGGSGAGGNIALRVGTLAMHGQGVLNARTTNAAPGGLIDIAASDSVTLGGGAVISTSSGSTGNAGNIHIDAGGTLSLSGASAITTEALLADGGNIAVQARELVYLNQSSITTRVGSGIGNGGNITIDPVFVVLQGGSIIADAFGGNGGNITIDTQFFFRDPASVVSASSQLGINGNIIITSPTLDLSGALLALASGFLDPGALQTGRCAARTAAGQASSFVVRNRGGLAPRPEDYLLASAGARPAGQAPRAAVPGGVGALALWQASPCAD